MKIYLKFLSILLLLLICTSNGNAQVILGPLEENQSLISFKDEQHKNLQICPTLVLSLPFFDDFANNPNAYHPNCAKWQDNHAFINDNMAFAPPSIGTATLDGLDSGGRPYDKTADPNAAFPADTLTSQIIDLSGKTAASNIILSYFYQAQGFADRPESGDSLFLEFLDIDTVWQKIIAYDGISNAVSQLDTPRFNQDFVILDDSRYFHANFQFRFRNLAAICGNNDHWHLDHVYMDENRTDTTAPVYYSDICYSTVPMQAFKKYSAIPWRHFESSLWNDTLRMRTFNHSSQSGTLDRTYTIEDTANLGNFFMNVATPSFNYLPSPNIRDSYDTILSGSFGAFAPTGPTQLRSRYTIDNPTAFQGNPLFVNSDTAYRYTTLDNYFAYDDGTPEMRAFLQGIGTQLAVEYKTTVDDTLRGIYFHLPHYINRNAEDDFINVKVWVDNLQNEVFSRDILRLRYVGGFGGMYYVQLADFAGILTPIGLPANTTFYIGWQQASSVPVPVGVDRSIDRDDVTFVKVGGNAWQNTDINCAVMIRPVLSPDENPILIPTEHLANTQKVSLNIYPNPSEGIFNLQCSSCTEGEDYKLNVFNSLGQLTTTCSFSNTLDLGQFPSGLYYITLSKNEQLIDSQRIYKK